MEEKHVKKEARVVVGVGDGKDEKDIDKTKVPDAEPATVAEGENEEKTLIEGEEEAKEGEEIMPEEEEPPPPPPPPPPVPLEEFFESHDAGGIDLAFTEHLEYESSDECYPPSYYKLIGKERLLLLYAENFRKQFHTVYPDRRPLVLAVKNECEVQKLVCTTIRPTAFLFVPLIANLEGCATFVADFIEYQPLENPFALVSYWFKVILV